MASTHFSAGVWFQRLRDNEDSGSRQLGIATFASITTMLRVQLATFQVIPNAVRTRVGEAGMVRGTRRMRSIFFLISPCSWDFDTSSSGWNEVSNRGD